jgi:hypothetical protein
VKPDRGTTTAEDHHWPAIHGLDSKRFSPDLLHRVRIGIERCGYCIFGVEEMQRLLSVAKGRRAAKAQALQEFARLCGVQVETTPHFKSATFHTSV